MDAKSALARFEKAKSERQRFEPIFNDAIRLTMPGRARFDQVDPRDAADDIFDETGANSVQEFTSRMQAGLFPSFTNFIKLEASSLVDKADRDAVNRDLEEISEYAFEEIWASNFAQEGAESLLDLCISTGMMNVEDAPGTGLMNRAIPITEFYVERGLNDMVGGVFRQRSLEPSMIEATYPHARFEAGSNVARDVASGGDKELDIVEYTWRDWTQREETYRHIVVNKDHNEVFVDRTMTGAGSSPFLPFRWSTAAGEVWGRGPLMNALAAIRTTNLMVELVLENAAMSIVGMYQTDNDGVVNADNINLLPGTIITKELGTRGLEPINAATGNFNMQDVVLGDQRLNIRKALFNDMLSDPNKTPATATEVVERMADLAHRTSSGFSRVFYEFLAPYMRRVLYILEKRGDIKLPVMNGRAIKFRAVSPLAQAQHGRELQALMQDFMIRSQMQGPTVAATNYDLEMLHPWLQKRIGLDERLHKPVKDIVKSIQAQADIMAQMQQPAQAPEQG